MTSDCIFAFVRRADVDDDIALARELAERCGIRAERAVIGTGEFLLGPQDRNPTEATIYDQRYAISVRNCATKYKLIPVFVLTANYRLQ